VFGFRFINASSRRPVSPESIYASYGPRDEEPRHRSSNDAGAGGNLRVSGRGRDTAAVRALPKGSFAIGFEYFCRGTEISEQRNKTGQRKAIAHPPQTHRVVSYFPTLLHPRSSAGVFHLAHRDNLAISALSSPIPRKRVRQCMRAVGLGVP
jgi:hypothetical protein